MRPRTAIAVLAIALALIIIGSAYVATLSNNLVRQTTATTTTPQLSIPGTVVTTTTSATGGGGSSSPSGNGPAITSFTEYLDNFGFVHVIGSVKNEGMQTVQDVAVEATFFDTHDNIIAMAPSFVMMQTLLPGQSAPFDVQPDRTALNIARYTIQISNYAIASVNPIQALQIQGVSSYVDQNGFFNALGSLVNGGNAAVNSSAVVATFFNSTGGIVAIAGGFSQPDYILASNSATFDLETHVSVNQISSFTIEAQANPLGSNGPELTSGLYTFTVTISTTTSSFSLSSSTSTFSTSSTTTSSTSSFTTSRTTTITISTSTTTVTMTSRSHSSSTTSSKTTTSSRTTTSSSTTRTTSTSTTTSSSSSHSTTTTATSSTTTSTSTSFTTSSSTSTTFSSSSSTTTTTSTTSTTTSSTTLSSSTSTTSTTASSSSVTTVTSTSTSTESTTITTT